MNIEIKDEILAGEPRYRIRDNNGNILQGNVNIEQITPVKQVGTPMNKGLFENVYNQFMDDSKLLVVDYIVEEDTPRIEITNLNLIDDGGIYELIITGGTVLEGNLHGFGLQINGITSGYRSDEGAREYMLIGCGYRGGISHTLLSIFDSNIIYAVTNTMHKSSSGDGYRAYGSYI